VTGSFKGTVTFGDTTLSAGLDTDIFIAKYDANGNFLWAVQAGGTGNDSGNGIVTDGSGNSIVIGGFSGTATFGDTTLTSASGSNIFIAKIDSNGNFLWVAQAGGTDSQSGISLATDGSGNSIVIGGFSGTATFGDTTLTSAGYSDIFIAKYDAGGNFLWAVQAGGTDGDTGNGIATDGSGNITMTGKFSSTATFGDTTLTSVGDYDIFIAKYDTEGNFLWAAQIGGMEPQYLSELPRGIATDGFDNIIVTGGFAGTATFGNITLTSAGYYDVFIAKYDNNGNFLWAVQAGGTDDGDVGNGIATDGSGNIIVTGGFYQTSIFGDTTLTSAGYSDIFIAKLGPGVTTGIEEEFTLPRSFNLWQNYPNPFNPITRIKYSIPESGLVTLKIYDLLGRVIKTLVNEFQEPNTYSVDFDASELSSGIYFYNLSVSAWLSQNGQSGNFSETRKMILMK